ncbi:hypothetical protein DSUL_50322 [Desulfovibrionales bacterium]
MAKKDVDDATTTVESVKYAVNKTKGKLHQADLNLE